VLASAGMLSREADRTESQRHSQMRHPRPPFYTIPESSSTVKTSSILWNWTGLQQGSRLAALTVPSPQSLNDGTAGPFRSYLVSVR
jgi:hypothetical protein